jgi:hypothetical protein
LIPDIPNPGDPILPRDAADVDGTPLPIDGTAGGGGGIPPRVEAGPVPSSVAPIEDPLVTNITCGYMGDIQCFLDVSIFSLRVFLLLLLESAHD